MDDDVFNPYMIAAISIFMVLVVYFFLKKAGSLKKALRSQKIKPSDEKDVKASNAQKNRSSKWLKWASNHPTIVLCIVTNAITMITVAIMGWRYVGGATSLMGYMLTPSFISMTASVVLVVFVRVEKNPIIGRYRGSDATKILAKISESVGIGILIGIVEIVFIYLPVRSHIIERNEALIARKIDEIRTKKMAADPSRVLIPMQIRRDAELELRSANAIIDDSAILFTAVLHLLIIGMATLLTHRFISVQMYKQYKRELCGEASFEIDPHEGVVIRINDNVTDFDLVRIASMIFATTNDEDDLMFSFKIIDESRYVVFHEQIENLHVNNGVLMAFINAKNKSIKNLEV